MRVKLDPSPDVTWLLSYFSHWIDAFKGTTICGVILEQNAYQLYPVSVTAVESAHSTLKEIKTKKRSTTGSDRLSALILLHVHTDITLDLDDIIDIYVREYPRRMKLWNPMERD